MEHSSVWLGSLRGPVRMAMIVFTALALVIWVWLVANRLISAEAHGM